ncbi:MAG: hypothetical protein K5889_00270 [Lachnospiraceae bacterium]|nr:hypothetical protein [Lachnospiraceae bacterium]
MAKFYLNATKLKSAAGAMDSIKSKIDKQQTALSSISLSEWGVSNAELKELRDSLEELKKDIGNESKAAEDLSRAIGKIVDIYTSAEESLAGEKAKVASTAASNNKKQGATDKNKKDLIDEIDDIVNRIPRPERDFLMFLLGCIPGINVMVDAYSFISDLKKYMADGKLSPTEIGVLGIDAFCLIADVSGTAAAFKALKGAKAAKAAAKETAKEAASKAIESETAKKAAEKTAQEATENTVKMSAKATEAAEEVSRARAAKHVEDATKSTKYYRRMVKKAEKAERDANHLAKAAEAEEKLARRSAKEAANRAAADRMAKKSADKAVKQAQRNIRQVAKKSVKPDRAGAKRFVANETLHLANDGPN